MTSRDAWAVTVRGMPNVGNVANRSKLVTKRDIELYTEITGDRNPLHYDERAAQQSTFGGLIVQGGVTSGILNAIVAEDLPGPGSVFLSMDLKFVKAVYVGDEITGTVEVTSVREDKPICAIAFKVTNQRGDVSQRHGRDVHRILAREGLTPTVLDCFVAYFAGYNRPVHKVLFPTRKPMETASQASSPG
jgi:acyl dehydratase